MDIQEKLANENPKNEELQCKYIFALAKLEKWDEMRQCVMKMQKSFKNPRYFFWNVLVMLLQVIIAHLQILVENEAE